MRRLSTTSACALAAAGAIVVGVQAARAFPELTGYGATRKAWAANHRADPNPKLIKGCCYLPRQKDGTDRYYAVQRDEHGRVFTYSMHFAPRVSASFLRFLLRRDELPPDARLVRRKRKPECLILQYRSAAAKRALGSALVGVAIYSSETGPYTGKVKDVIISGALVVGIGC